MIFRITIMIFLFFTSITVNASLEEIDLSKKMKKAQALLSEIKNSLSKTIELSPENNQIVAEVIDDYSTFAATINPTIKKENFANMLVDETKKNGVKGAVMSRLLIDIDNSYRIDKVNYARILNPLINKLNPEIGILLNNRLGLEQKLNDIKIESDSDMRMDSSEFEREEGIRGRLFNSKLNGIVNGYRKQDISRRMDDLGSMEGANEDVGMGMVPQRREGPLSGLMGFVRAKCDRLINPGRSSTGTTR
ncbi:MAG: hypothetical protein HQK51_20280 [Oligoflexia bacterium]|nr:hypothetical protein [Oligoflexia bacterium]